MDTSKYIDAFLQTLPKEGVDSGNLFVIGLIGLPGSGKSTFSKKLADKLNLYIASNDEIRRWLEDYEEGIQLTPALVESIAEARSRFLLEHKIPYIIDGDLIRFQDRAVQITDDYGAKLFVFKIVAPEDEILERLRRREERSGDWADELSRAGQEEYARRKAIHENTDITRRIDLTIDSTKNIDDEVERAVTFLTAQG